MRYVSADYNYQSSVTTNLKWPPLTERGKQFKLNMFYQIVHRLISQSLPDYYLPTSRHTRQQYPLHLIVPHSNTTSRMASFFPKDY